MPRLSIVAFFLSLSTATMAQTPFQLKDYAWQAAIDDSSATLLRVDLTLDILRGVSHQGAADIAVFDANGQALPTLLRGKPPLTLEKWDELKFQRFERTGSGRGATITLDQQQIDGENGQVTRLGIRRQVQLSRQRPDYIIELDDRQLELGIDAIELDWVHQPATDFLKLDIQVANDIDNWRTIQQGKNLFKGEGRSGEWVTLTGLPAGYRYYRLRPQASINSFELKLAHGRYRLQQEAEGLVLGEGALMEDPGHPGFFKLVPPLAVDARALRFILPSGFFLSGNLYSSTGEFDKKRMLHRAIERHNLQGMHQAEWIFASFNNTLNYWFEPKQKSLDGVSLEFAYPPYELLFINNRQGPFTLAWGNYEVADHPDELSRLVAGQDGLDLADASATSTGSINAAGGKQRQVPAAVKPWLTWTLWALLALAVVITSRMAWTLYRDMNR